MGSSDVQAMFSKMNVPSKNEHLQSNGPAFCSHWTSSNASVHNFIHTTLYDLKPNTVAYGGLVRIWNLSIITFVVGHNIIAHSHVDYLKILIVVETTSQVTETCTLDTDKFIDYLKS